ncbi:hypothetical protein BLA29_015420, partial [Euroglyphus maynei]
GRAGYADGVWLRRQTAGAAGRAGLRLSAAFFGGTLPEQRRTGGETRRIGTLQRRCLFRLAGKRQRPGGQVVARAAAALRGRR